MEKSFPWPRCLHCCPAVAFAVVPVTSATADPPAPVPALQHNNLVPIISRKRELTHLSSTSSSPQALLPCFLWAGRRWRFLLMLTTTII